jgi:hypothetical protein
MDLNAALQNLAYDVRMKDFNLRIGTITKEEIEKNDKALKDHAPDCENVTLEDRDNEML